MAEELQTEADKVSPAQGWEAFGLKPKPPKDMSWPELLKRRARGWY